MAVQAPDAVHALLAAVPTLQTGRDEPLVSVPGQPPSPADMPAGCPFAPRCAFADDSCRGAMPPLVSDGVRDLACWHPLVSDAAVVELAQDGEVVR